MVAGASRRGLRPVVALTGRAPRPGTGFADAAVVLDFADEAAVVHTRFATTEPVLLRALFSEGLGCLQAEVAGRLPGHCPKGASVSSS
jgi:hypothetical protein